MSDVVNCFRDFTQIKIPVIKFKFLILCTKCNDQFFFFFQVKKLFSYLISWRWCDELNSLYPITVRIISNFNEHTTFSRKESEKINEMTKNGNIKEVMIFRTWVLLIISFDVATDNVSGDWMDIFTIVYHIKFDDPFNPY